MNMVIVVFIVAGTGVIEFVIKDGSANAKY